MRLSIFTLSCVTALILFSGCTKGEAENTHNNTKAQKTLHETFSPLLGDYTIEISATASVQPSPDGIVSVSASVPGIVSSIHAKVGDKVSANAPLISIRSSDVSDAQSNELSAKAALTQAQHVYEMNKELFKLGAITANDLALSQSTFQQAQAAIKGFSQKLSYLGASSNQNLTLRSPIDGVVYEVGTHLGEKVTNDTQQPLMRIANTHKKMVLATVYEKDISAFYVGKEVSIALDDAGLRRIKGTVTYVSDLLDAENKTIKVYIQPKIDSPDLRINMFTTITLGVEKKGVFRVPKESVLFKEGKFIVFLKKGKGDNFVPLNVTFVSDDPRDDYSLIKGLPEHAIIAREPIAMEKE
jgi:cobalt-zinc-cadmium efflux system membrane fusion protein